MNPNAQVEVETFTPVPGAEPTYDDDGRERVDVMTCGTCGRSWNDAAVSSVTPVPSGRCPFEYEHDDEPDELEAGELEPSPETLARVALEQAHARGFAAGYSAAVHDARIPGSRAHQELTAT